MEFNKDIVADIERVNDDNDIKWIHSFLSADKKKTYCLYEAPNADAIYQAARTLGIPADSIIEFDQIGAAMFQSPHTKSQE